MPSAGCCSLDSCSSDAQRADATAATMLSHGRGRGARNRPREHAPQYRRRTRAGVKRHQAFLCFRNVHKFDAASAGAATMDGSRHGHATLPTPPHPDDGTRCRVALLGFGTVGRAVARILCEQPPPGVELTHIFNRGVSRKRVDWVPASVRWTDDIADVLDVPRRHRRRADGRHRPRGRAGWSARSTRTSPSSRPTSS